LASAWRFQTALPWEESPLRRCSAAATARAAAVISM
jgi:hypothetical protein